MKEYMNETGRDSQDRRLGPTHPCSCRRSVWVEGRGQLEGRWERDGRRGVGVRAVVCVLLLNRFESGSDHRHDMT